MVMKELSIEEKAKRYDKAIERAKAYKGLRSEMEIIFPELRESEDERIRNFISNELVCLRATDEKGTVRYNELTEAIAYLEKQGEKKPTGWSEKLIADVFEMVGLAKIVREQENDALTEALQSAMIELAKYSVVPQIRQEWSEEDKKRLDHIIQFLEDKDRWKDFERAFPIEEDVRWLKSRFSLKQCNYNPYKATVESIAEMCEKYKLPTSNLSDFLDNVKVKCKEAKEYDTLFPHSTWKPSEAQMDAMQVFLEHGCAAPDKEASLAEKVIESLYNDLKKLKG